MRPADARADQPILFRFDAQADGTLPGRFRKREDHAPHYGRSLGQVHVFEGLDPRLYHFGVKEDA